MGSSALPRLAQLAPTITRSVQQRLLVAPAPPISGSGQLVLALAPAPINLVSARVGGDSGSRESGRRPGDKDKWAKYARRGGCFPFWFLVNCGSAAMPASMVGSGWRRLLICWPENGGEFSRFLSEWSGQRRSCPIPARGGAGGGDHVDGYGSGGTSSSGLAEGSNKVQQESKCLCASLFV